MLHAIWLDTSLAFLWTTWLVGWLLGARLTSRTVARQSPASRMAHAWLMRVGAVLLLFRFDRPGLLARSVYSPDPRVAWAGVFLTLAGLACTVWARVHLGRL